MANVKVELDYQIYDGMSLTFKAPCDCTAVTGLIVYYPDVENDTETSKVFVFKDTHGNELTGIGNLFSADSYVKVVLDIDNGFAYVQNADTNGYLEGRFADSIAITYHTASETANMNDFKTLGLHFFQAGCTLTNLPTNGGVNGWLLVLPDTPDGTNYKQIWLRMGSDSNQHNAYFRTVYGYNNTISDWAKIITSKDFTLTNGVLNITTT